MPNAYRGEIELELYHIKYPMKIDMSVISEFQSETGEDFMHCAMKAVNAIERISYLRKISQQQDAHFSYMDAAVIMTEAVKMEHAALLFYIAAKRADKLVTLGEIQEAVLFEGPVERTEGEGEEEVFIRSYPIQFAELMIFATLGVTDTVKKPKSKTSEPNVS